MLTDSWQSHSFLCHVKIFLFRFQANIRTLTVFMPPLASHCLIVSRHCMLFCCSIFYNLLATCFQFINRLQFTLFLTPVGPLQTLILLPLFLLYFLVLHLFDFAIHTWSSASCQFHYNVWLVSKQLLVCLASHRTCHSQPPSGVGDFYSVCSTNVPISQPAGYILEKNKNLTSPWQVVCVCFPSSLEDLLEAWQFWASPQYQCGPCS